jgi:hypothetical protein
MKAENDIKYCPQCKLKKDINEFHMDNKEPDKHACYCTPCQRKYNKKQYEKHRTITLIRRRKVDKENRTKIRNRKRERDYNVSNEKYNNLKKQQDNKCAVCKEPFNKEPHIDHDHNCCPEKSKSCGKCIRGLLCTRCNCGLGLFRDNPIFLQNALNYIGDKA